MNHAAHPVTIGRPTSSRRAEGEGILRLLLLAAAVAMPMASVAYLKVQNVRLSYEMADIRARIKTEEELQRKLMLVRSQLQRDEDVQSFATSAGLLPRKQAHFVQRAFTTQDQKMARLRPVSSEGF